MALFGLIKRKKKITMQQFIYAVQSFAKEYGQNYISLEVCYNDAGLSLKSTRNVISLKAYINGFGWVEGFTIEEIIERFREKKMSEVDKSKISDVQISS